MSALSDDQIHELLNREVEFIPPPIDNWHMPEVRIAFIQGQSSIMDCLDADLAAKVQKAWEARK